MTGKHGRFAIAAAAAIFMAWGGVNYYRAQAQKAREASIQADRVALREAMERNRIDLRDPEEIAADKARKVEEASQRAQAKALEASQAKLDEIKRERAMRYALAGALALKQAMKDPESFVMRSATMHANGATCYEYRGKNSFGAVLPARALIDPDGKMHAEEGGDRAGFASAWSAHCQAGGGREVVDALKAAGVI